MRVGAAVREEHELRECVGAFGAAEEGGVAGLGGVGGEGGEEVGGVAEGAVERHWLYWLGSRGCGYGGLLSLGFAGVMDFRRGGLAVGILKGRFWGPSLGVTSSPTVTFF